MRTILIAQMAATFGVMNRDAVRQVEMNRAWVLPDLEASKLWDIAVCTVVFVDSVVYLDTMQLLLCR